MVIIFDSDSKVLGSSPSSPPTFYKEIVMSEKEKAKLKERIAFLETELKNSLHKKSFGSSIDIGKEMTKIQALKLKLIKSS